VTKSDLYPVIADLRSMGYTPADIARAVQRSRTRVTQILRDLGMAPKKLHVDDLPHDLRERIKHLTNDSESQA
jgi:arsenate reductase-like glutaredoxin family protein